MIIVLYSDKGYEKMVDSFLRSRKYAGSEDVTVLYYTIGFESDINCKNLIKKRWEIDPSKIDMTYYKPEILIDSLSFSDTACFLDCDVVLSKRFSVDKIENKDLEYPICCKGPIEFVWVWHSSDQGTYKIDETNLMDYYGVTNRANYIWASMISYNKNCIDFLEEWSSILNNKYLLKRSTHYFPFREETALNVLYSKRGINHNVGLIFHNTITFKSFLEVETSDNFSKLVNTYDPFVTLDFAIYETCESSSIVQFYHGLKPGEELDNIINWMESQ